MKKKIDLNMSGFVPLFLLISIHISCHNSPLMIGVERKNIGTTPPSGSNPYPRYAIINPRQRLSTNRLGIANLKITVLGTRSSSGGQNVGIYMYSLIKPQLSLMDLTPFRNLLALPALSIPATAIGAMYFI